MTTRHIEKRLEQLEREVAELRNRIIPKKDWWRDWAGIATDDPVIKEAFRLALKYREDDRKEQETRIKSNGEINDASRYRSSFCPLR